MDHSTSGPTGPEKRNSEAQEALQADELVSLIYDTAFEPQLWPQLLQTLHTTLERQLLQPAADDTPALDNLSTHFERALGAVGRIYQMQAEHRVLRDFLNMFPVGVAIVQSNGAITAMNDKAEQLIWASPLLSVENERLRFPRHPGHTATLQRAIRQITAATLPPDNSLNTIQLTTTDQSLSLWVTSVHDIAGVGNEDFAALLMTGSDAAQGLNTDAIYTGFGLTPAERRLLDVLLGGCDTLPEAAAELGLSPHTVRSQLRSICDKAGVSSKTELLKKVLTSPQGLLTGADGRDATPPTAASDPSNPQPFQLITLRDGRNLEFTEFGHHGGTPLLYLHSTVHSRWRLHPFSSYVDTHGIRVIAPERPGYGRSDPPHNSSLKESADDIRQLLDHLGIWQCHIVADGDGCPYALAAAAQLPGRIRRAALIASFAPPQFDRLEKMVSLERLIHGMNQIAPLFAKHIVKMTLWGLKKKPEKYFEQIYHEMHASDQAVVDMPEHGAIFREQMENLTPENIDAYIEAYLARLSPWDFAIDEITVPVDIWHGVEDTRTPVAFARHMHETIPDNRAFILKEQGHYLFYTHWDKVLKMLLAGEMA